MFLHCIYLFAFLGLSLSVNVSAQTIPEIPVTVVSVRTQVPPVAANVAISDTLRKPPARLGPPLDRYKKHEEPLFVVDGVFFSSEKFKKVIPHSIDKIEVIKGTQAVAIYGQKGINGILIVTTKKPVNTGPKEKGRLD